MRIAVPTETDPNEKRVAATPDTVKKLIGLDASVAVQAGAGLGSGVLDEDYRAAGASVGASAAEILRDADLVLKVRRPTEAELPGIKRGATVVAIMDPYGHEQDLAAMARAGVDSFAMELMPRITRAQVMDVLSSQANLAGYRAVIDAAAEYGRAIPLMMTAAGTVPAAKCFVMGVGVAGLQAIATARRLGAAVTATDVRPATKEQVESLGAKFVAVEDAEFRQAETAGGYAKEMSKEYQARQAELVASHIAKQDIVITTALIPGRPAPRLVTADMVRSMRRGSVIVDLAVERGGNCELSRPGETVDIDGVKILGHLNVPSRIAATASSLYARNLYAFVETLIDKASKSLAVKWDDELVRATSLTRGGEVVHPSFGGKPPAPVASAASQATPGVVVDAASVGAPQARDPAAPVAPRTPPLAEYRPVESEPPSGRGSAPGPAGQPAPPPVPPASAAAPRGAEGVPARDVAKPFDATKPQPTGGPQPVAVPPGPAPGKSSGEPVGMPAKPPAAMSPVPPRPIPAAPPQPATSSPSPASSPPKADAKADQPSGGAASGPPKPLDGGAVAPAARSAEGAERTAGPGSTPLRAPSQEAIPPSADASKSAGTSPGASAPRAESGRASADPGSHAWMTSTRATVPEKPDAEAGGPTKLSPEPASAGSASAGPPGATPVPVPDTLPHPDPNKAPGGEAAAGETAQKGSPDGH